MYETAWSHQTEFKSSTRVLSHFVCYQNTTFAFCVWISAVRIRCEMRREKLQMCEMTLKVACGMLLRDLVACPVLHMYIIVC